MEAILLWRKAEKLALRERNFGSREESSYFLHIFTYTDDVWFQVRLDYVRVNKCPALGILPLIRLFPSKVRKKLKQITVFYNTRFIVIASCISLSFSKNLCSCVWLVLITFMTKHVWIMSSLMLFSRKVCHRRYMKIYYFKIYRKHILFLYIIIIFLLKIRNKLSIHNKIED